MLPRTDIPALLPDGLRRPSAPLLAAAGAEIRPLTPADQPLLRALAEQGDNRLVSGSLGIEHPDFVVGLRRQPWSAPMALSSDGAEVGVAFTVAADTQHGHCRLMVLANELESCRAPLALFIRHIFWSYPAHRIYAAVPATPTQGEAYDRLLRGCGLVVEGRLVDHLALAEHPTDVLFYGLLRSDFDVWCREREPEWPL